MFVRPVPIPAGDPIQTLVRYQLFAITEGQSRKVHDRTRRASLQSEKAEDPIKRRAIRETIIRRIENTMQREITDLLRAKWGRTSVTREQDFADIRVSGKRHILIEVKADTVARRAIRDALGQLLFYDYRDGRPADEPELIVVGQGPVTDGDQKLLDTLKARFGLDVGYRQYRVGSLDLNL